MNEVLESEPSLSETLRLQIDEDERVIFIFEDVSAELLQRLVPALHHMDFESDDPITLHVGSPGGSAMDMFSLADAIHGLESPVNLQVYGQLSSAATVLYGVCAHRIIGPYSETLLHGIYFHVEGNYTADDFRKEVGRLRVWADRWARIMSLRGNVAEEWLRRVALGEEGDLVLTPATLVMIGWADVVQEQPNRAPTAQTPDTVPPSLESPSGE